MDVSSPVVEQARHDAKAQGRSEREVEFIVADCFHFQKYIGVSGFDDDGDGGESGHDIVFAG